MRCCGQMVGVLSRDMAGGRCYLARLGHELVRRTWHASSLANPSGAG